MKVISYLSSVRTEAKFIKWPTSKTTTYFTVGILFVSIISAIYLWILDMSFTELLTRFIST